MDVFFTQCIMHGTHIDTGVVVVAKGDAWGREADGRRGAVLTGTEQHGGVVDVEEWQHWQVGILSCMCYKHKWLVNKGRADAVMQ